MSDWADTKATEIRNHWTATELGDKVFFAIAWEQWERLGGAIAAALRQAAADARKQEREGCAQSLQDLAQKWHKDADMCNDNGTATEIAQSDVYTRCAITLYSLAATIRARVEPRDA